MAIGEIDWGTVAVERTDRELSQRFTRLACDGLRNGLIVRELPWRLRAIGFGTIWVIPEVQVSLSPDAFHHWFIEPAMTHFKRIGGFSSAEADLSWRHAAAGWATNGQVFLLLTGPYYSIVGIAIEIAREHDVRCRADLRDRSGIAGGRFGSGA